MIRPRLTLVSIWPNIFLVFLSSILILRLVIWQFFRETQSFFREEFSDVTIAFFILSLGLLWLLTKAINVQAFKKSGLELPIFLFVFAAACSLFYTVDFSPSLKGALSLGAEVVFFYMFLDVLDTPVRLRFGLVVLLSIAFVASIYGVKTFFDFLLGHVLQKNALFQQIDNNHLYLLRHPRAISFFGWPNSLAGYLLLFLPLSLTLTFYLKAVWQKAVAMLVLFLNLVCFLYTSSFSGWLSFSLSAIMLYPFFWEKFKIKAWPKQKKRMFLYSFFGFTILFLLVVLRKDFLASFFPRLSYYKSAFTLLAKNPLWGYGLDSFRITSRPLTPHTSILSGYVHNSYLQAWVETGVVGFFGIILLAGLVFNRARAAISEQIKPGGNLVLVAIAWGLIAFLIDNLFNFTILTPNVALYWWAMLAVFCAMPAPLKAVVREGGIFYKIIAAILITVMLVALVRIAGGYVFYYQAHKARSYNDAQRLLNKAQVLDPWSSYLPAEEANFHLNAYGNTRLKVFLKRAENDYLEAIRRSPMVYYNYFALGQICIGLGEPAKGEVFIRKAKKLSPKEFELDTEMFNRSAVK